MPNDRGRLPKAARDELDERRQRMLARWFENAYRDDNLFLTMARRPGLLDADRLAGPNPIVDTDFYEALRRDLSDDEILDLGMTATFVSGWQRFIEAFGIVPDHWHDGAPPPFRPL